MLESTLGEGWYLEPMGEPLPHTDTSVRWEAMVRGITAECLRHQRRFQCTTSLSASDVALGMTKQILTEASGQGRKFGNGLRLKDLPNLNQKTVEKAKRLWTEEHGNEHNVTPVTVTGKLDGQYANMMFHWNAGLTGSLTRDVSTSVELILQWMAKVWVVRMYEGVLGREATDLLKDAGYDQVASVLPVIPETAMITLEDVLMVLDTSEMTEPDLTELL